MKKNNQTRAEIVFDEINEVENMLSEQPKESTHITWWKGLNEEEQTKLCQKHFQGIPVESLMERSIKVMYHYENPETTTNTVTGEGLHTKGEWKLDNTFYHIENTCVTDYNGNTIAECFRNAYHKDRKIAEANANRIVNCVNNFDSLVSALKRIEKEGVKVLEEWTKGKEIDFKTICGAMVEVAQSVLNFKP